MNPKRGNLSQFTGTLQGLLTCYTVKNLGLLYCPRKVLGTSGAYCDFSGTLFLPCQIQEKSHEEMKSQKTPTYGYTFAILHNQD